MGMSTHVVGFKPPDEKWRQMKAVWDACAAAMVEPPEMVSRFFNDEPPDESGVTVDLPVHHWSDGDMQEGLEVKLDEVPSGVTIIRFVNSY